MTEEAYPDAKLHKYTSFVKSGIRIVACIGGLYSIPVLCIGLALAEVVGIIEEMV